MIDFSQFVTWAFYGLITLIFAYSASILKELKDSVKTLNENMATMIERSTQHEKRLDKHDIEIDKLKDREI